MRKIKEVLRLRYELKLDQRQIARCCSIFVSTVHDYLKHAEAAKVSWPLPDGWENTPTVIVIAASGVADLLVPALVHSTEPTPDRRNTDGLQVRCV